MRYLSPGFVEIESNALRLTLIRRTIQIEWIGVYMFVRALIAFIVLPGFGAFIAPFIIAYIDPWIGNLQAPGLFVICLGAIFLLWCVRDFYVSGRGTLAPWDPPKKLVVVGLYRFMRNPMYSGVLLLILGWGLYFLSPLLILYDVALAIGFHIRIVRNEEPMLKQLFGEKWEIYAKEVPRWLPRRRPWKEGS